MIHYGYVVGGAAAAKRFGLKVEERKGWRRGILGEQTQFVHKSNLPPETVKQKGISPMYAKDYFVDENGEQIGSGKMVFAFPKGDSGKAIDLLFGRLKYTYVFEAEAGTEFYCSGGRLGRNKEVAFPYIVEPEDIVSPK